MIARTMHCFLLLAVALAMASSMAIAAPVAQPPPPPPPVNCALGSDELAVCGLDQTLGSVTGDVNSILAGLGL
ncbi:hypothetical protein EC991_005246 [Linnemannia zychae]|nr:hypothetical protein EC991_005246 [Linnemannia zychae]